MTRVPGDRESALLRGRQDPGRTRQVGLAGAVTTLLILVALLLGLFKPWERALEDWRFRSGRTRTEAMGADVAYVLIDDGSLRTHGRWPWPRALLSEALEELARLEVRTVALDVLVLEHENSCTTTGCGEGDHRLAKAVAASPTTLAVSVADGAFEAWPPPGSDLERRLLEVLVRHGFEAAPDLVAEEAGLDPDQRLRYLGQELTTIDALLRRHVSKAGVGSVEQYLAALGRPGTTLPDTRTLVVRAWHDLRAWQQRSDTKVLRHLGTAPVQPVMAAAQDLGFVDLQKDSDGTLRSQSAVRPGPVGPVTVLSIAAARAHQPELALPEGPLRVAWPTLDVDRFAAPWVGIDGMAERRVSIGALLGLTPLRERLAELEESVDLEGLLFVFEDLLGPEAKADDQLLPRLLDLQQELAGRGEEDPTLQAELDENRSRIAEILPRLKDLHETRVNLAANEQRLRQALSDKLVFVGLTATGLGDIVRTPLDARMPGVILHGLVADQLLEGRRRVSWPAWIEWLLVLGLGALATGTVVLLRSRASAMVTVLLLALYGLLLGVIGFDRGSWMVPMAAPLTSMAAPWLVATVCSAALADRQRRRITRQFRSRASAQLVDRLVAHPETVSVSGEARECTILFLDLAGFTSISESLGGARSVKVLNEALRAVSQELIARDAYVNKFLGDGVMAFWSAFDQDPDQVAKACAAGLACLDALDRVNDLPSLAGVPPVSGRVGIATGVVIVGDCGAPPDLNDYTAIGDPVNLAARLEPANKSVDTRILLDEETARGARAAGLNVRPLGRWRVRGRQEPVEVAELLPAEAPVGLVARTEAIVQAFRDQDGPGCERHLATLEAEFGPSRLIDTYRAALRDARALQEGVLAFP